MPTSLSSPSCLTELPVLNPPHAPVKTPRAMIEGMPVDAFANLTAFFDRIVEDIRRPEQTLIANLNVHAANIAHQNPEFKRFIQRADSVFCDGAGIVLAAKILGGVQLPTRFTAADYMPALLRRLADENLSVYFLASEPGVAERAIAEFTRQVPDHTIIGWHHGYILKDPELEKEVVQTINALNPDILFVGMGMPLQEQWIDRRRDELKVGALFPMGATLDYFSQKVPRCPQWMGDAGFEWLFRLSVEPVRMFERYVLGNPAFLMRIVTERVVETLAQQKLKAEH